MSSAYGTILGPNQTQPLGLPLEFELKSKEKVHVIEPLLDLHKNQLFDLLNQEIRSGDTYPQEFEMNLNEFENYFLSSKCFVVVDPKDIKTILGTFYIKPNFPGRCSHICNGGFITSPVSRNLGVGKVMGLAYLQLAPKLGYKGSMFNLVFETNEPSIKLWRSLGFKEIGKIPKAGRLSGNSELIDAIMFYFDFEQTIATRH